MKQKVVKTGIFFICIGFFYLFAFNYLELNNTGTKCSVLLICDISIICIPKYFIFRVNWFEQEKKTNCINIASRTTLYAFCNWFDYTLWYSLANVLSIWHLLGFNLIIKSKDAEYENSLSKSHLVIFQIC